MDDYVSESDSDYTSYWRDWVSHPEQTSPFGRVDARARHAIPRDILYTLRGHRIVL
jgi:hypothetical protein